MLQTKQNVCPAQPRKSCKDVFHAYMVEGCEFAGSYNIPIMQPEYKRPKALVSFNEAVSKKPGDLHRFVHFYKDDVKIECFWNSPKRYIEKLSKFDGVIAPDFSVCPDFPQALKIWNTYRNFASGCYLQKLGLNVLPNVRLDGLDSVDYALAAVPRHAVISMGLTGCVQRKEDKERTIEEIRIVTDIVKPEVFIFYGQDTKDVLDYPRTQGVEVIVFPSDTAQVFSKGDVHDE